MLDRLGREGGQIDDQQLGQTLSRQLEQALQLLAGHDVPLLRIAYRDALRDPQTTAGQVAEFLGCKAAKLAGTSIADFAAHLSQLGIPVVDYDSDELAKELRYFE